MVQSTHRLVLGESEVVKTYVDWSRGEPDREWQALTLLDRYSPGLSPRPIRRGESDGHPYVVMSRLPGEPLGGQPLTPVQVAGLAEAIRRMYTAVPEQAMVGLPARAWSADRMLARVRAWIAEPRERMGIPVGRALSVASDWLCGPEASAVATSPAQRVFTLADGNLGNVLWDGTRCRLVDFEDAGLSDLAYEVADLVEHVSVWLDGLVAVDALAPHLMLTAEQRERLLCCRRLFAVFWLLMLLPGNRAHQRNPVGTIDRQAHRVMDLMS